MYYILDANDKLVVCSVFSRPRNSRRCI